LTEEALEEIGRENIPARDARSSVYLLYWYKSTNTVAKGGRGVGRDRAGEERREKREERREKREYSRQWYQ
jgi:hypothetical protein